VHLAIVCPGLGSGGGVANIALGQARALAAHADVTCISDSIPAEEPPGIRFVRVRPRSLRWLRRLQHVPAEILFAKRALQSLRSLPPVDFVIAHGHTVAWFTARPYGVPFGLVVQADIFERPRGTYDPRLTVFYRWVTPRAYRAANVIFALSRQMADFALLRGARHVEVVFPGIDPAELGPAVPVPNDGGPFRILSVGRLSVEKGLDDLLDACALLEVRHELTIAGDGPLREHLRSRAGANVVFRGALPRNQLGAVYAAHDVFCIPSRSEPFGLVVLEALACGVPVIGTSVGGIPHMVTDGMNGLLVAPGQPVALAAGLARLAGDEKLRSSLAGNARSSALTRFSWSSAAALMLDAIRTMRP
jgi:glycosyltransferase involved in cell wall biosynthesis